MCDTCITILSGHVYCFHSDNSQRDNDMFLVINVPNWVYDYSIIQIYNMMIPLFDIRYVYRWQSNYIAIYLNFSYGDFDINVYEEWMNWKKDK